MRAVICPSRDISMVQYAMAPMMVTDPARTAAYSTARPKVAVRMSLGRRLDDIPKPANGVDQLWLSSLCDLGPQPADLRLHNLRFGIEMILPYLFKQHCTSHDPFRISHQVFKQLKLARL